MWILLFNTYNGDALDGYWYNNAATVGQQLYPQGIYKYFDMSSFDGYLKYTTFWFWVFLQNILSVFTLLIPIDIWIAMFEDGSWDKMEVYFLYYLPWLIFNPIIGMILDVR